MFSVFRPNVANHVIYHSKILRCKANEEKVSADHVIHHSKILTYEANGEKVSAKLSIVER